VNVRIEQAKEIVRRAKGDYIQRLKQAEGLLKVVAAQDPADIDAALAVQASYGDIQFADKAQLAPLQQPVRVESDLVQELLQEQTHSVVTVTDTQVFDPAFVTDEPEGK
jgi:hypothetical protein